MRKPGTFWDPFLVSFMTLYRRIKSHFGFVPPSGFKGELKRLNGFRNSFIHFSDSNQAILVEGFPDLLLTVIALVKFCSLEGVRTLWETAELQQECQAVYDDCVVLLQRHMRDYEALLRT